MRLKMFGVIWTDGDVQGVAPGITVRDPRLTVDGDIAYLQFVAEFGQAKKGAFRFALRFRVTADASGLLYVVAGQEPLPRKMGDYQHWRLDGAETATVEPELGRGLVHLGGGYSVDSALAGRGVVSDTDGFALTLHRSTPLILQSLDAGRPMRVSAVPNKRCRIDLKKGQLFLDAGIMKLSTGFTLEHPDGPQFNVLADGTPAFEGRWAVLSSEARTVALTDVADPATPVAIKFATLDDPSRGDIPLHVGRAQATGSAAASVSAGAVAREAGLELVFRNGTRSTPHIEAIRLVSRLANAPFKLMFAGAFGAANRPVVFSCGSSIELAAQKPKGDVYGSFVIRPTLDKNSPGVALTANTDRIYGAAAGNTFHFGKPGAANLQLMAMGTPVPVGEIQGKALIFERLVSNCVPYLRATTTGAKRCAVITAQPGTAWAQGEGGATARYELTGSQFALPLVPQTMWQRAPKDFRPTLDQFIRTMQLKQPASTHESRLRQLPANDISGDRLFQTVTDRGDVTPLLVPKVGVLEHDFGGFVIRTLRQSADAGKLASQYTELTADALVSGMEYLRGLTLDAAGKFLRLPSGLNEPPLLGRLAGWPRIGGKPPLKGILKIGRADTLSTMLLDAGIGDLGALTASVPSLPDFAPATIPKFLDAVIDQRVLNDPDWVGLVLFGVPLEDIANTFGAFVPAEACKAHYLALEAAREASRRPGIWARLRHVNQPLDLESQAHPHEAYHHVNYVDFAVANSNVSQFQFKSQLRFQSFLGQPCVQEDLTIIGSLQQTSTGTDIGFQAIFAEPRKLFGKDLGYGPFKQVWITRLAIQRAKSDMHIVVDGRIDIHDRFNVGNFEFDRAAANSASGVDFFGLSLTLPRMTGRTPRLSINYPSLMFDASLASFNLFKKLDVTLAGLGVDLESVIDANAPRLSWALQLGSVPKFSDWIAADLHFAFCELPDLADTNLSDLTFKARIGLPFKQGWNGENLRASLSALTFEPMRLNLARIVTITADSVTLDAGKSTFSLQGAAVKVLDTTILSNLSAAVRQNSDPDNSKTFYLHWAAKDDNDGPKLGPLQFDWFVAGRGLRLEQNTAKQLLEIPKDSGDFIASNKRIKQELQKSIDQWTGGSQDDRWLFAAGFKFGDMGQSDEPPLVGRALFLDRKYYGLSIRGRFFKELFESDLVITGLYTRREPRERDSFYLAVTVPRMTFSTFQFTGGEVAIELFANGDFIFDGGFPHLLPGGGRQWDRAFGVILTPFQGSGGMYFSKTSGTALTASKDVIALEYGYAVQAGLGACFKAGPVVAWATVGVYAILSGKIVFTHKLALRGVRILGAVGVLVRGVAQLDWWIISVRLEVVASAEMRGVISWGKDETGANMTLGCGGPESTDIMMQVAFELRCTVRASACIGSRPFRICKGISVSLPMSIQHCLKLGSAS